MLEVSDDNFDNSGVRSRMKEDIFHQFQDLPYEKKCPIRPLVSRLLIHATFKFIKEDYKYMVSYLREKKNIVDVNTHFYHRREWWKQRVRMAIPKESDHAHSI